jgi:exopolysaccharide biosynthesis polyprenyl glycosylphosphotransferase
MEPGRQPPGRSVGPSFPEPAQALASGEGVASSDLIEPNATGSLFAPRLAEDGVGAAVDRKDRLARCCLAGADAVAALAALTVALSLLHGVSAKPTALLLLPVVVVVNKVLGLYDRDQHLLRHSTLEEVPRLFEAAILGGLLLWIAQGAAVSGDLGKSGTLALLGCLAGGLVLFRAASRAAMRFALPADRCLVVGDAGVTEQVRSKMGRDAAINAELVGRIPVRGLNGAPPGKTPVLGELDQLEEIVPQQRIERILIAPDSAGPDQILEILRRARALGVKVSVLPRLFEAIGSSVEFDDLEGVVILGMREYGLGRSSRILKRSMDLVGATATLLVLAPAILVISLAVRLGPSGPVLFRQRRIGREGREFKMLKFRTMYEGADAHKPTLSDLNESDGFFKIADDPRVTPVGRLLRRTYLDEIPQLVNVLLGDMSLVGPRPLVPDEDRQVDGAHPRRLHLTPGITGMWQIFGSSRVPMREMIKIDYLYGANWSPWLDVKILLRTLPYVLGRRGL